MEGEARAENEGEHSDGRALVSGPQNKPNLTRAFKVENYWRGVTISRKMPVPP